MRIVGFMALHYGLEYIEYAIRSIINHIDTMHIIYSPVGSHGHRVDIPCPESEEDLYNAALRAARSKLVWTTGLFDYEGQQRDKIFELEPDADAIIVCDSDEIYPENEVPKIVEMALEKGVKRIRTRFAHFYRSFYWAILHDPAYPHRCYLPKYPEGENTIANRFINHMGYSIKPSTLAYKMLVHGHKGQLRPNYLEEIYLPNRRTDCHIAGSIHWNAERVNPEDFFPSFMKEHPYWGLEVIE